MDAYHVHKRIQEAVMALEIYILSTSAHKSIWDEEIRKGLSELHEKLHVLESDLELRRSAASTQ